MFLLKKKKSTELQAVSSKTDSLCLSWADLCPHGPGLPGVGEHRHCGDTLSYLPHICSLQARALSLWEWETNVPLAWAWVSPQFCTAPWLNRKDCKNCTWQMGVGSLNYMWLCMHMHTHACTRCMHTHARPHIPTGTHITHKCMCVHIHEYTHACTYRHAHTCTFTFPAALEAYLPKGMQIGQVKANNPIKKCDAYVT